VYVWQSDVCVGGWVGVARVILCEYVRVLGAHYLVSIHLYLGVIYVVLRYVCVCVCVP
jgi:hypothetical protein